MSLEDGLGPKVVEIKRLVDGWVAHKRETERGVGFDRLPGDAGTPEAGNEPVVTDLRQAEMFAPSVSRSGGRFHLDAGAL